MVTVADGGIGHLGQTPELPPDHTVRDAVDAALAEVRAMERGLRELEADLGGGAPDALAAYGDLLTAFEARGGYEADARVEKALHGLGLGGIGYERRLGSLSGGEQARLGLACLIAAAPEVMLLDEPTNHLDGAALSWLEEALRAHPGTVLAVSHDRVFLERVATAIVEVDADRRALVRYGGGYGGFVAEQTAARRRWEQAYEEWCAETAALRRGRHHRRTAGRPGPRHEGRQQAGLRPGQGTCAVLGVQQGAQRQGEAAQTPGGPGAAPAGAAAVLRAPRRRARRTVLLIDLHDVRVGERLAVDRLTVATGERLLVHGANGAGKSTLLRVMAGWETPDAGRVTRRGRIGYLAQEIPVARPRERLLSAFGRGLPGTPEEQGALLLSYGLFRTDDLHVPVGSLSAGQRRRLALARLLARPADLLLLDEPTNHLALGLVEELEEALAQWTGALVVVSHDRLLRSRFTGRRCEIRGGRPMALEGERHRPRPRSRVAPWHDPGASSSSGTASQRGTPMTPCTNGCPTMPWS